MTIAPAQRFSRARPCPICGGGENFKRGSEQRCTGFLSDDGRFAHCSRPEHGGALKASATDPATYRHRLAGRCGCGREHGSEEENGHRREIEPYDYLDAAGKLQLRVVRFEPKSFRQCRPDGRGGLEWNTRGVPPLLYRLPQVGEAIERGDAIYVVEGERDVHALERLGLVATTCPMGAGKWRAEHAEQLAGAARVVVFPDLDEPGRKHARNVADSLVGKVEDVRIVELAVGRDDGFDVRDWLWPATSDESRTQARALLEQYAEKTPPHSPSGAPASVGGPDRRLDDIGNAERFADQHAGSLLYVDAWRETPWLAWDGRRWSEDDQLERIRRAKSTARSLLDELDDADEQRQKELLRHVSRSGSSFGLNAMLNVSRADPRIIVRPRDLDADPFLLNTTTGVVDLQTRELRPHDPADRITMLAGAAYRPDAEAPLWEAHLSRCLVDPELIAYLQRVVGVTAIGLVREHLLLILAGDGENGKTTLVNALGQALGEYAHTSTLDLLMQTDRAAGRATPELAALRGRRLVAVSETPEDGRLSVERVKAITGGSPITARYLHGKPFTFDPSHTIWLDTNHRPRIADDGHAIWRRVALVPFTTRIPDEDRDPAFGERLAKERDGILRWIVDGAYSYLRDGLKTPESVRAATAAYREEENSFAAFLEECATVDERASVQAAELGLAYAEWAKAAGAPSLSRNALADRLRERGFERKRTKNGARWLGLRLRDVDGRKVTT